MAKVRNEELSFKISDLFSISSFNAGGGKDGLFYTQRYSTGGGLNSPSLDFLPVQNIEQVEVISGIGAVPVGK